MLGVESTLLLVLNLLALALAGWAVVDAAVRPAPYYEAAGKLTKPAWVAITAIAAVLIFLTGFMGLLGLVSLVASIVYLVDVRPALQQLKDGRGPYG